MMSFSLTEQAKIILFSTLSLILLGGGFYGGWKYWQSRQSVFEPQGSSVEEPKPTGVPIPITKPTADPDWNLYINEKYGFSVGYPAGWKVKEEKISQSGDPEYVARDKVSFRGVGKGYITIFTRETSPLRGNYGV